MLSLSGVLGIAITGSAFFLRRYLERKAENLATKEDLAALTRPVEAIKLEFRLQEERARAVLGRELAAHRVLFDHEFAVYRDLWKQVLEVRDQLDAYQVPALAAAKHGPADWVPGYANVRDAARGLMRFADTHRPFFAPDVNAKLMMLSVTLRQVAVETSMLESVTEADIQARISQTVREIGDRQRALEEAIRLRLYPELWLPKAPVPVSAPLAGTDPEKAT